MQQIDMYYQELSEHEKESDREWVQKRIAVTGILAELLPDKNAQHDDM